ncbi:MAG: hypothetical protein ABH857_05220 [Elusimicrobiota bacterium]
MRLNEKHLILFSLILIFNISNINSAPEIIIKLDTNDGSSSMFINNSNDLTISSVTSNGLAYFMGGIVSDSMIESRSGGFKLPDSTVMLSTSSFGGGLWDKGAGSNIYYNEGNIGIGTNNPIEQLEVTDNIKSAEVKTSSVSANALNGIYFLDYGDNVGLHVKDSGDMETGNSKYLQFIENGGRQYQLQYKDTPDMVFQHLVGGKWAKFKDSGGYSSLQIYCDYLGRGGVIVGSTTAVSTMNSNLIVTEGFIGIGSTNPAQKLDISKGNIRLSNGYQVDFGDNYRVLKSQTGTPEYMSLQGPEDVAVVIDNNSTGTSNYFRVKHDSNNPASAVDIFTVSEAGKLYVTGNLGIGAVDPVSTVWISSAVGKGQVYLSEGLNGTGYGLGITPGIIGGIYGAWNGGGAWQYSAYDHKFKFINIGNGDYDVEISSGGSFIGAGAKAIDANGLKVYDDAGHGLFVEDGGYIGIGTTNPGSALEVTGNIRSSGSIQSDTTLFSGAGSSNAGIYLNADTKVRIVNDGTTGYIQFATSSVLGSTADLNFTGYDGAPNYMTIKSAGNIGIGTNNPLELLHVAGDILSDTTVQADAGDFNNLYVSSISGKSPLYVLNGVSINGQMESMTGGFKMPDGTIASSTNTFAGTDTYWDRGTSDKIYYDSGNIGIGTTNPTSNLFVYGTMGAKVYVHTSSGTYNLADFEDAAVILAGNDSGYIIFYLPDPSACPGRMYFVKDISSTDQNVAVAALSGDTVNGVSEGFFGLYYRNDSVWVVSDGVSGWEVVANWPNY